MDEIVKAFGVVKTTQNRREIGDFDVYHTGFKRKVFYYPSFGVYKNILWFRTGDMEGVPQSYLDR